MYACVRPNTWLSNHPASLRWNEISLITENGQTHSVDFVCTSERYRESIAIVVHPTVTSSSVFVDRCRLADVPTPASDQLHGHWLHCAVHHYRGTTWRVAVTGARTCDHTKDLSVLRALRVHGAHERGNPQTDIHERFTFGGWRLEFQCEWHEGISDKRSLAQQRSCWGFTAEESEETQKGYRIM